MTLVMTGSWKDPPGWSIVAAGVLIVVATGALAGCLDGGEDGSDGSSEVGSGSQGCQIGTVTAQGSSTSRFSCQDVEGEDTLEDTFPCEVPDEGSLDWDADIQTGEVEILVEHADSQKVVEVTLQGSEQSTLSFGDHPAGEWTMTAELSSDFAGSFIISSECPLA